MPYCEGMDEELGNELPDELDLDDDLYRCIECEAKVGLGECHSPECSAA